MPGAAVVPVGGAEDEAVRRHALTNKPICDPVILRRMLPSSRCGGVGAHVVWSPEVLGGLALNYGQISENKSINEAVYECFQHIEEIDAERFVKEFRSQPHDEEQALHTFRELILGSYLARKGFRVRAYQRFDGKEPDWSLLGERSELLVPTIVIRLA